MLYLLIFVALLFLILILVISILTKKEIKFLRALSDYSIGRMIASIIISAPGWLLDRNFRPIKRTLIKSFKNKEIFNLEAFFMELDISKKIPKSGEMLDSLIDETFKKLDPKFLAEIYLLALVKAENNAKHSYLAEKILSYFEWSEDLNKRSIFASSFESLDDDLVFIAESCKRRLINLKNNSS